MAPQQIDAVTAGAPPTMPFPAPILHPQPVSVPPAMVRNVAREDILWNRPVFKAPPLVVLTSPPAAPTRHPTTGRARRAS